MSKNKEYLIKRGNSEYEVIIGLEVHAQVLSKSKLFSDSPTNFGAAVSYTHLTLPTTYTV